MRACVREFVRACVRACVRASVRTCVRTFVRHKCARDSARNPGHDRLMQTYDVMRLDINIFPLIRQTSGPPRLLSMGKLLLSTYAHAYAYGIVEIFHLVPSIPTALQRRWPRDLAIRGRQTTKIPRRSTNVLHCIASHSVASSSQNRFMPTRQSFRRRSYVKARLRKDTRMRARYLTQRGTNVDNRIYAATRAIFASHR